MRGAELEHNELSDTGLTLFKQKTVHYVENRLKWSKSWSKQTHWELLQNFRWEMTVGARALPVQIWRSRWILDKFWGYTCQDVLMAGLKLWEKRRCQGRHHIFWAEPKDVGQSKIIQACSRRMLYSILLLLFYLFVLISCPFSMMLWTLFWERVNFYIETSGDASVWLVNL